MDKAIRETMRQIRVLEPAAAYAAKQRFDKKKEDVLRLVEAQIAGCVDLSPEEMVDAAFLIVERIDNKIDGKE